MLGWNISEARIGISICSSKMVDPLLLPGTRQKNLLEGALDWCVDSTHHTCRSMTNPDQFCYLYTMVVRSPSTNKGVPVAFMLTLNEIIPSLVKWFNHLKATNNLNVQRIMIDCSTTEIGAIQHVFGDVDILLCHWHIKRARFYKIKPFKLTIDEKMTKNWAEEL